MKTLKINKFFLLLLGLVIFNSCVEDDDFDTPNTTIVEPVFDEDAIFSEIGSVFGRLAQVHGDGEIDYDNDEDFVNFDAEGPDEYIVGYVISTDEGGNFFEELIIQNSLENPTHGIRFMIDVNPLFVRYEVGRKVYIKVNGLYAGISNGVVTLGTLDGDRIGKVSAALENDFILRSPDRGAVIPKTLAFSEFTNENTNQFIRLENVQFIRSEAIGPDALTYAAEPEDQFDGERSLESCDESAITVFSTSTFADFQTLPLPQGKGSMNAILSKDFFGEVFNIVINTPEDINFDNDAERCDPVDISDFNVVFEEDFEDGFAGWTVINTEGTREWDARDFDGVFYARGSSFQSGSILQMVSWLISPSIDFDAQNDESMVLEIADAFHNGDPLKAYYSNDYVAGTDPSTATWTEVGTSEILGLPDNPDFFNNEYDQTGLIDLSGVTGNAVIAFVYDSNNSTVSTTIDLSTVKIVNP